MSPDRIVETTRQPAKSRSRHSNAESLLPGRAHKGAGFAAVDQAGVAGLQPQLGPPTLNQVRPAKVDDERDVVVVIGGDRPRPLMQRRVDEAHADAQPRKVAQRRLGPKRPVR